jgi:signal transduction histidine kinase
MLTNLLTNAARYGARRPIEVRLRKLHGQAVLSVRDHGGGVAPADRERIFGKFERAVSRNEVSGLGLGLFIVREIMHSHGGLIRVEGEKGEGATFIAELPLYKTSKMVSEAVASHDVTNLGGRS